MIKIKNALRKFSLSIDFTEAILKTFKKLEANIDYCFLLDIGKDGSDIYLTSIETDEQEEMAQYFIIIGKYKERIFGIRRSINYFTKLLDSNIEKMLKEPNNEL